MKFDELFPDALIDEDFPFDGSVVFKAPAKWISPCWHCGEPTAWMDLIFETHLCSEECERSKWEEYRIACLQG